MSNPCSIISIGLSVMALVGIAGCTTRPSRPMIEYPPGTWPVRFESSEDYSSCLVASVVMCANYLENEREFSEAEVRAAMQDMGLDHTLVGDIQRFLQRRGLDLIVLKGELGQKPPVGIGYWSRARRYPVICVINRDEQGDPGFNHAVVVIGITENPEPDQADMIHYFDPSSPAEPLISVPAPVFEIQWTLGQRAMMIVVSPPPATESPAGSVAGEVGAHRDD